MPTRSCLGPYPLRARFEQALPISEIGQSWTLSVLGWAIVMNGSTGMAARE